MSEEEVPKQVVARRAASLYVNMFWVKRTEEEQVMLLKDLEMLNKLCHAFAVLEEDGNDVRKHIDLMKVLIKKYDIKHTITGTGAKKIE